MSKTIEELLDKMLRARDATAPVGYEHAKRAITEPWNAAVKAMESYVQNNFHTTKKGVWHCEQCRGSSDGFHRWHTPGKCHVATFQAAIAEMKGETDGGS